MRGGFANFVKRPSQVPGTSHDAVSIHYCFHLGWSIEMGFVRTLIFWASISKQTLHQKHHKGIRKCRKWIMHVMYPFILTVDKFLLTEIFIKTVMYDLFFFFCFLKFQIGWRRCCYFPWSLWLFGQQSWQSGPELDMDLIYFLSRCWEAGINRPRVTRWTQS